MRRQLFLPALALSAAAATLTVLPGGAAQAVNGKLGIHAVTKTVTQGDTSRVKGKVVGAGKGVTVTIQQRSGGRGKDWGSGRKVTTDAKGKFSLDRVIKGKYTRDYRACIGPANRRQCSLRARVEVVPRTGGIFLQTTPANVTAGAKLTVKGSTDAALANRPLTLEQLNPSTLQWLPVATGLVSASYTFELSGTPLVPGKAGTFRVSTAPFAGRPQISLSPRFSVNVFGLYALTGYAASSGGFKPGPTTFNRANGEVVASYAQALTPTQTSASNGTVTFNLAGNCDRLTASAFLDPSATGTSKVGTSITTAIGANTMVKFGPVVLRKGDRESVDIGLADVQSLTITENTANQGGDPDAPTFAPVWYGDPILSCAL